MVGVFGGSGRTGLLLVRAALDSGHAVRVLARSPGKISLSNEGLVVIKGDIKDKDAVAAVLDGAEAVISVLGPTNNLPVKEVSAGMRNILAEMEARGIRRLIATCGAGIGDPNDSPRLVNRFMGFLLKRMAENVLADMEEAIGQVRSSNLDWTVVRLPMLTDAPATGRIKVGYVGKGPGARISRADIPSFILGELKDRKWLRKSPAISN